MKVAKKNEPKVTLTPLKKQPGTNMDERLAVVFSWQVQQRDGVWVVVETANTALGFVNTWRAASEAEAKTIIEQRKAEITGHINTFRNMAHFWLPSFPTPAEEPSNGPHIDVV